MDRLKERHKLHAKIFDGEMSPQGQQCERDQTELQSKHLSTTLARQCRAKSKHSSTTIARWCHTTRFILECDWTWDNVKPLRRIPGTISPIYSFTFDYKPVTRLPYNYDCRSFMIHAVPSWWPTSFHQLKTFLMNLKTRETITYLS